MTVDVVCAGPPFLDLVFRGLPRLPEPGEELLANEVAIMPGAMANVAFAMRQLGPTFTALTYTSMAGSVVAGGIATSIIATLIMAGGDTALRMGTQDSPGMEAKVAMAASPGMVVAPGSTGRFARVQYRFASASFASARSAGSLASLVCSITCATAARSHGRTCTRWC